MILSAIMVVGGLINTPLIERRREMAKIISCTCSHEFQDKKYGKGKRVFNETTKGYRCTVCEKEILK